MPPIFKDYGPVESGTPTPPEPPIPPEVRWAMIFAITGVIDGANQTFTLSTTGLSAKEDFSVFYNGVMLDAALDYSFVAPTTITLTTIIPTAGDKLWGLKYLI